MKMTCPEGKHCPSTDQEKVMACKQKWQRGWLRWFFPLAGLLALLWFLVRVIPKASRATYPCQRVAFPLASSFIIWLTGTLASAVVFRKAKYYLLRSRYVIAIVCIIAGIGTSFFAIRDWQRNTATADSRTPNDPVGVAQGINPGRVVWIYDSNATDWDGPYTGDGHWWEAGNTKMALVDQMFSLALHALTDAGNSAGAWDALFRHFNQTHDKGDIGYQAGEKITIKVNFVGFIHYGTSVDPATYELVRNLDYMNTSPQMMLALLRQLVYEAGAAQADITIGDTVSYFPNQYYDILHDEFPDVHYLDYAGTFGRTAVQASTVPFYWSKHPTGVAQDYVPLAYAEADYIINMANLKSHTGAAVTLCGKNHYGSLKRWPGQSGYYNLHIDLPSSIPAWGHYRNLVDLMGHEHIGGKTLLYCIDGLYAGEHPSRNSPTRMTMAPFGGDWSSSIFMSQDPVAIDSVGFDILWTEANEPGTAWSDVAGRITGGDDYLLEAAQADNPPSNTFYDPNHEGDVTRMASQGVHEHWNNATDRLYSRNLGSGIGIELSYLNDLCEGNFNCPVDQDVDGSDAALFKADFGRSLILDPCTGESPCNGDHDCDGDADGSDASVFKQDFGRGPFQRPCPACMQGEPWCVYR